MNWGIWTAWHLMIISRWDLVCSLVDLRRGVAGAKTHPFIEEDGVGRSANSEPKYRPSMRPYFSNRNYPWQPARVVIGLAGNRASMSAMTLRQSLLTQRCRGIAGIFAVAAAKISVAARNGTSGGELASLPVRDGGGPEIIDLMDRLGTGCINVTACSANWLPLRPVSGAHRRWVISEIITP